MDMQNARRASRRRSKFCAWGVWGDAVPLQKRAASERTKCAFLHTRATTRRVARECVALNDSKRVSQKRASCLATRDSISVALALVLLG